MSYRERQVVVSLISTILIAAIYFLYVLPRFPQGNAYSVDVFHFWGSSVFALVPVSIIVKIITEIVFSMAQSMATNERDRRFTDERDKLIELRGLRNTLYTFALGFTLAMGSL